MTSYELNQLLINGIKGRVLYIYPEHVIVIMLLNCKEVKKYCKSHGIKSSDIDTIKSLFGTWVDKGSTYDLDSSDTQIHYRSEDVLAAAEKNYKKNEFLINVFADMFVAKFSCDKKYGRNTPDEEFHRDVYNHLEKYGISLEKLFPEKQKKLMKEFSFADTNNNNSLPKKEENTPFKNIVTEFIEIKENPVFGRDDEINMLQRVLLKLNKSNAVMLGKAGVGKTAVVEGLAWMIAHGKCHPLLAGKEILSFNMNELTAGTCWRGELEKKLKDLLEHAEAENSILFIDEIHQLAGHRAQTENIMDVLKEKIARGRVRIIGATTDDEYRKIQDTAFRRRFQEIDIKEPSAEMTFRILGNLRHIYQDYYNLIIGDAVLQEVVAKSKRFIHDRNFPDKAIDLLASACVLASQENAPKDKDENTNKFNFLKQTAMLLGGAKKKEEKTPTELNADHVNCILSTTLNLPMNMLCAGEKYQILHLEEKLRGEIFGQDAAIAEISDTLVASYALRRDISRPESIMFLAGPSGVGKTETAEVLAKILGRDFVRLNMSEYQTAASVSKLSGAEPGYIGFENGGQLSNAIERKPYSVILLDEFEKAHPDVQRAFMQVFDKGMLVDNTGKELSLKNNIIIMASNAGVKYPKPLGFGAEKEAVPIVSDKKLENMFLPEFLGRINKIVKFTSLSANALDKIINKLILDLDKYVSENYGHNIEMDDDAKSLVISAGFSPNLGARLLKDTFYQMVERPLAKRLLENNIQENSIINISANAARQVLIKINEAKEK